MANRFSPPGPRQASRVHALFTAIAPRYDLINDLQSLGLHRRWKRRLVQGAAPAAAATALDVCCGTGDVALSLAARGMRVVALDFSAAMLAIAQARARRLPAPAVARPGLLPGEPAAGGVSCLQADALRLPLAEASVDLVTISYGLRNLADLEQGLQELWRVLRPGGRLRVLDFGKPPQAIWRALYFAYLRFLVPVLGWLVCGDAQAYAYILRSLQAYPSQPVLAAKLTGLGWINVQVTNLLGGVMGIHSAEKPGSASRSQDPGVAAGAAQARDSRRGGRAGQPGPCGPT